MRPTLSEPGSTGIQPAQIQDDLKRVMVRGTAGQLLPRHACSHAAFLLVQAGQIALSLEFEAGVQTFELAAGDFFLIPASTWHHLKWLQEGVLQVVLSSSADIRFA